MLPAIALPTIDSPTMASPMTNLAWSSTPSDPASACAAFVVAAAAVAAAVVAAPPAGPAKMGTPVPLPPPPPLPTKATRPSAAMPTPITSRSAPSILVGRKLV